MRKKWVLLALPLILLGVLLVVADSRPKSEIELEIRKARVEVDEIQWEWLPAQDDIVTQSHILLIQRGADALQTIQSLHPDMHYFDWQGVSCYSIYPRTLVLHCHSHHKEVATIWLKEDYISYRVSDRKSVGELPYEAEIHTYINNSLRPFGCRF